MERRGGNILDRIDRDDARFYLLDDNGLPIEKQADPPLMLIILNQELPPPAFVYRYTYEFDQQGNWIKRSATMTAKENGKLTTVPFNVIYRKITYF